MGTSRFALAAVCAACLCRACGTDAPAAADHRLGASAAGGDRTLYLHHTHTDETGRFTFKRNGQYDQERPAPAQPLPADWRHQRSRRRWIPPLFDLLWVVYQEVGASQPINIVSSYRSPETNACSARQILRRRREFAAHEGQGDGLLHPRRRSLKLLRDTAMQHQVGGVGYYPTSGSPFVHLDTGNVRAWPRMTTRPAQEDLPRRQTLHIPTDGTRSPTTAASTPRPSGSKCHMVPCNGADPASPAPTTRRPRPRPAQT